MTLRVALSCLTACLLVASAVVGSAAGGERSRTSPASRAAGADCSRASATALVKRLGLSLNEPASDPVARVLCGSFTGPGSQTMVVTLAGPTGPLDWIVFRWAADAWQFVMRQSAGASISAAGSDIRQTLSIYRPGDPRCCPTGGTKSRLWHWDGTRFVAGPWKQLTAGVAKPRYFYSPSHNISCSMGDPFDNPHDRWVNCESRKAPQRVNLHLNGELKICRGRRCIPNCGCAEQLPTLGYGRQITVGRFRCYSLVAGVKCIVIQSGKGFLIDRARIRSVG